MYTEDGDYVSTFSLTWSWPTAFLAALDANGVSDQDIDDNLYDAHDSASSDAHPLASDPSFFLTSVEPSNGQHYPLTPRRPLTSPAHLSSTALNSTSLNLPPPPLAPAHPPLPRPQALYLEVTPPYRPHTLQKFALETDNFSFESAHAGYLQVEKERQAMDKREQLQSVSLCFQRFHRVCIASLT